MKSNSSSGFTLIEVMIVLAIIGILALCASPFYLDYVVRSQVSEGMTFASAGTTAVAESYMHDGVWPADNSEAGIDEPDDINGTYVSRVEVIDGVLAVTFGNDANETINGKTLGLQPVVNDEGDVVWACGTRAAPIAGRARATIDPDATPDAVTTLPAKYLPQSCRT